MGLQRFINVDVPSETCCIFLFLLFILLLHPVSEIYSFPVYHEFIVRNEIILLWKRSNVLRAYNLMLQPNGRFETNKKICLSISGHHPETWQPSWSIRTALLALIAFMPTPGNGTIGSLDYTPEERQMLARK